MLSLVALGFTATSIGIIIFQIINKNIVDITESFNSEYDIDALKLAISAIIVCVPIFFIMTWQINKNLFLGLLDKNSGIRKWLTYFILFASSVVIIGYLISLIFNFLNGELSIKFILKTITAIIISGIVFSYYFYDIKRKIVEKTKSKISQIYFYGALLIIIATLISSIFFVESPQETRNKKQDYMVAEKIFNIKRAINSYYFSKKKLPENFEELLLGGFIQSENEIRNPKTKEKVEYKIISEDTYELCANFKTSNKNNHDEHYNYPNDQWFHDAGYQCIKKPVENNDVVAPILLNH
ncbi:hypothetical protein CVV26_01040 [Candidatus Kuenenbacteria bacterium HGW-Kuenenbacteria-1]|uniref:DUF5671 domain-containing protein n=1 Tax=Candidatus Kuenenbacteria bacterium HGW-Kuenenbacteria-1 TaxID=2013812 RepID=A0A2N1UNX8_9BACT|nr:MAG: hypothetical protein CVV26_01040 [Candidatus Kuenenbacteria bacterium HGW-Kuenenbacteria-1]